MTTRHNIPDWVTRGKSIRQLIAELQLFEDQDREVRISLDYGENHHPISIVEKHGAKFCFLVNAESYYKGEWQKFMDRKTPPKKAKACKPKLGT